VTNSSNDSLTGLLKATSRSFYLTLRVLPAVVRSQIGLAYLLARTTDTIADTDIIPRKERLEALRRFRARILGESGLPLDFGKLAAEQGAAAERLLLVKVEAALAALGTLSRSDQDRLREVLTVIISGQELDLERFAAASVGAVVVIQALENAAELEDYTYRVAGCVGEFWTKMCRAHVFPKASLDEVQLLADGVRFGQGLQLVNILRDLPADLKNGRCYLPRVELKAIGLEPVDLLNPDNEARLRPLYNRWLDCAEGHLRAGWDYTNMLPRGGLRLRLACAWPVLIGLETVKRLRAGNILDPGCRVKISRRAVRRIILRSIFGLLFPGVWRGLAGGRGRTGKAVALPAVLA
jgi:farnesyl-diphosphate farnesyltransferase